MKQTQCALRRLWARGGRTHLPNSWFPAGHEVTAVMLPTMLTAALLAVIAKFLEPEN